MPAEVPANPLPEGFDAMLAATLAPGEADAAAAVLETAASLDDERLARFLEAFAELMLEGSAPITASDLQRLLNA